MKLNIKEITFVLDEMKTMLDKDLACKEILKNISKWDFKGYSEIENKQDKIKELFCELDLEEQRSLINEINDCIEVEETKHCDDRVSSP